MALKPCEPNLSCLCSTGLERPHTKRQEMDLRNDVLLPPMSQPQHRALMGPPYGHCSLRGHVPEHNPAVGITSQQATVLPQEMDGMHLDSVSTKHISGLKRYLHPVLLATMGGCGLGGVDTGQAGPGTG